MARSSRIKLFALASIAIITILLLSQTPFNLNPYIPGLVNYSADVTSCTNLTDANGGGGFGACSSPQSLPLAGSVVALTPGGQSITLYNSTTGKSGTLTKDARITLSATNAVPTGIAGTFTCDALVDNKIIATATNATTFSSLPNAAKVCSISINGKALQGYYNPSISTHIVSMAFAGKFTSVFATGATHSRSFSGSLGNITITITAPSVSTTTSASSGGITVTNDKIGISDGGGGVISSTSTSVAPVEAPLIDSTTGQLNPDYVNSVEKTIVTSSANTPIEVQVETSTITVNACDVGSCSYSPPTAGESTATVRAIVTESDKAIYERDAANTARMFGGYENMTPYSKCAYFSQC